MQRSFWEIEKHYAGCIPVLHFARHFHVTFGPKHPDGKNDTTRKSSTND